MLLIILIILQNEQCQRKIFGNPSVIFSKITPEFKEIIDTEVCMPELTVALMMNSNLHVQLKANSTPVTLHMGCLLLDIPCTKCTVTNRKGKNHQHKRINCCTEEVQLANGITSVCCQVPPSIFNFSPLESIAFNTDSLHILSMNMVQSKV
jgi:hypothetical protein